MSNGLPFTGSADRNKRNWTCFVCGEIFEDFLGFKLHILEEHEEGREFIKCPRCETPVRDLKTHWRVKHQGFAYPKGMQDRAIVWKDFSKGKSKTRKPKFRSGDFVSQKNGKELHYRSGMECEVYEVLERLPEVVSYDAEPIDIKYCHEGEWKTYKPDLSIFFLDGTKEIWEIKPKNQTKLPVNDSKWTYAQKYCENRGWKFMVLTEDGLHKLRRRLVETTRDN